MLQSVGSPERVGHDLRDLTATIKDGVLSFSPWLKNTKIISSCLCLVTNPVSAALPSAKDTPP